MFIGIDLALRKTGVVILKDSGVLDKFYIVSSDPKKVIGEDLLVHNREAITKLLPPNRTNNHFVALEGLSFNSVSADHDLISANHWITRLTLREFRFKTIILPPKAWQKFIVTKEFLAELAKDFPVVRAKKGMKHTKLEKSANNKSKLAIRNASKQLILESVPASVLKKFLAYITENKLPKDSIYDLCDAFFLAKHLKGVLGK